MDAKEHPNIRITETSIGDTVYIVESLCNENAKETIYDQIRRLILSHTDDPEQPVFAKTSQK